MKMVFQNDVAVDEEMPVQLQESPGVKRISTASGRVNRSTQPTIVQVMKYGYSLSKIR
jgi:hypothetical protein